MIAVISNDDKIIDISLKFIQQLSVTNVKVFQNLEELHHWILGESVLAILIDIKLLIHSQVDERSFITHLSEAVPVIKIRFDIPSQSLVGNWGSEVLSGKKLEAHIIEKLVKPNRLRRVRQFARKNKILNIKMHHDSFGKTPRLASTLNVSEGGLFIFSPDTLVPGDHLDLEILEAPHCSIVKTEVRWVLPWGSTQNHYPGMGLKYECRDSQQKEDLIKLLW